MDRSLILTQLIKNGVLAPSNTLTTDEYYLTALSDTTGIQICPIEKIIVGAGNDKAIAYTPAEIQQRYCTDCAAYVSQDRYVLLCVPLEDYLEKNQYADWTRFIFWASAVDGEGSFNLEYMPAIFVEFDEHNNPIYIIGIGRLDNLSDSRNTSIIIYFGYEPIK